MGDLRPSTSTSSSASDQLKKYWMALLGATLETWAHQLLYTRSVYPRETFGPSRFLGVRCFVCRHSGVVSYISNAIKVALPALTSGVADEISLTITDEVSQNDDEDDVEDGEKLEFRSTKALETYVIRISNEALDITWNSDPVGSNRRTEMNHSISGLERAMRGLILRVHSLEASRATSSDSVSFKISLHIPEENRSCAELNQAFAEGKWLESSPEHGEKNSQRNESLDADFRNSPRSERPVVIRPLHQIKTSMVSIQFLMRKRLKVKQSKGKQKVAP